MSDTWSASAWLFLSTQFSAVFTPPATASLPLSMYCVAVLPTSHAESYALEAAPETASQASPYQLMRATLSTRRATRNGAKFLRRRGDRLSRFDSASEPVDHRGQHDHKGRDGQEDERGPAR